jgi:hypothetical protein
MYQIIQKVLNVTFKGCNKGVTELAIDKNKKKWNYRGVNMRPLKPSSQI